MFAGDRWARELNSAEVECQRIAERLRTRDQHQRGSRAYIRSNQDVSQSISKVTTTIQELTELLNQQSITGEITEHEANRRQGLLRRLEARFGDLQQQAKTNARENFLRKELIGGDVLDGPTEETMTWGQAATSGERGDTAVHIPVQESLQAQKRYIQDQDAGLEQLSSIMSRTKTMAQNFTTEIDLHNEILDDVAEHLDTANERLLRNTERTRQLDFRSNTCGLWIIVILLFIAIVIVALI